MQIVLMGIPVLLGFFVILQTGLNRRIGMELGLTSAVLLNGVILTLCALVLWLLKIYKPQLLPQIFQSSGVEGSRYAWWFLIPGVLGFMFVAGAPWAVSALGAVTTFLLLVAAQLLASFLWDLKIEGIPFQWHRFFGILLAWAGVFIASMKR